MDRGEVPKLLVRRGRVSWTRQPQEYICKAPRGSRVTCLQPVPLWTPTPTSGREERWVGNGLKPSLIRMQVPKKTNGNTQRELLFFFPSMKIYHFPPPPYFLGSQLIFCFSHLFFFPPPPSKTPKKKRDDREKGKGERRRDGNNTR